MESFEKTFTLFGVKGETAMSAIAFLAILVAFIIFLKNRTLNKRTQELNTMNTLLTIENENHEKTVQNLQEELNKLTQIKTVSEIAASISHEVRNPLTVTRGFTQLLKDGSLTDEQRNQYIKLSLEELDRAERIIGDYLNFAKPSIENKEVLYLNQEIEYIVQVINPYATMNSIAVEVNMEDCQYAILGEKQKLRQSLLNIVKNGIEAIEKKGKITIQLQHCDGNAQLIISDNGKGMSAEQIKNIGTPYFSTKDKGTGLGTMVAFNIIKEMQGEYNIESQIGKGTTFFITFPLVEENSSIIV